MRLRRVLASVAVLTLAGCSSFGEGVTRALLNQANEPGSEFVGNCEITGAGFPGLSQMLAAQKPGPRVGTDGVAGPALKILMVHGIGTHAPGYSGRLRSNLAQALGMTVTAPQEKVLDIVHPHYPDEKLGTLTVNRFTNEAHDREVLYYELTWSRISDPAKAAIAFDNSAVYARQRASLNNMAKGFVNDVSPDPLVYVGAGRGRILTSVIQSMCWMYSRTWDTLPTQPEACLPTDPLFSSRLSIDNLAIFTHSLGSRISIDALTATAQIVDDDAPRNPVARRLKVLFQNETIPVFMMANQLPLLQAGFEPAAIRGENAAFCTPGGARYADRMFRAVNIVAFSDPNDLMSYSIPDRFVQEYLDSRLCPTATNVTLNITPVRSVPVLGDVADPLSAHSDYEADPVVIGLMTQGLGQNSTAPIVKDRCTWIRTDESLR